MGYLFPDHERRISAMFVQDSDQVRGSEEIRRIFQNVFKDLKQKVRLFVLNLKILVFYKTGQLSKVETINF